MNQHRMEVCAVCTQQVFAQDMFLYVQEISYQTGQIILHPHVCPRCASIIETHNEVYYKLRAYFTARYGKLAKLRGEYFKNREKARKANTE